LDSEKAGQTGNGKEVDPHDLLVGIITAFDLL
jgi:hypothetical protein